MFFLHRIWIFFFSSLDFLPPVFNIFLRTQIFRCESSGSLGPQCAFSGTVEYMLENARKDQVQPGG